MAAPASSSGSAHCPPGIRATTFLLNSGFSRPARLISVHRVFKANTGLTPKKYAVAHRSQRVREELSKSSTDQFPKAHLVGGDKKFERTVAQVVGFIEAPRGSGFSVAGRLPAFGSESGLHGRRVRADGAAATDAIPRRSGRPKAGRRSDLRGSSPARARHAGILPCQTPPRRQPAPLRPPANHRNYSPRREKIRKSTADFDSHSQILLDPLIFWK
jgi:hypothetical protein